jgi:hypothetical protein
MVRCSRDDIQRDTDGSAECAIFARGDNFELVAARKEVSWEFLRAVRSGRGRWQTQTIRDGESPGHCRISKQSTKKARSDGQDDG